MHSYDVREHWRDVIPLMIHHTQCSAAMATSLDPCVAVISAVYLVTKALARDEVDEQDDISYRPTYKDQDDSDCLCVIKLLNSYQYTVLNFVMFHAKLRHAICQVISVDGQVSLVDVLFKEDSVPHLTPPFSIKVTKCCYVQVQDITAQIPIEILTKTVEGLVMVVWECNSTIEEAPQEEDGPSLILSSTEYDSDEIETERPSSPTEADLHPHP